MLADRHLGESPREHAQLVRDQTGQSGLPTLGLTGDVPLGEEVVEARIGTRAVQVHDRGARDVEPAPSRDVELNRHVRNVLILVAGGRSHLDETEAVPFALQDVDRWYTSSAKNEAS